MGQLRDHLIKIEPRTAILIIPSSEIAFDKAKINYSDIILFFGSLINTSPSLKCFEIIFPSGKFQRCYHSYIVKSAFSKICLSHKFEFGLLIKADYLISKFDMPLWYGKLLGQRIRGMKLFMSLN
jgi:hypothetical protein